MTIGISTVKDDLETLTTQVTLTGLTVGTRYDVMRLQMRYLGKDDTGTRLYARELPDRRALWSSVAHRVGWQATATTHTFRDYECPVRPTSYFVCTTTAVSPAEWDYRNGNFPLSHGVLDNQVIHFAQDQIDLNLGRDPEAGHLIVRSTEELSLYVSACIVDIEELKYTARVTELAVLGNQYPVIVADTREARRGTITLLTRQLGQYNDLRRIVFPQSGVIRPVIFNSHGAAVALLDDMRVIPLDVSVEQVTPTDTNLRYVHIDFVESDPTVPLIRRTGDNDTLVNPPIASFTASKTNPKVNEWITLTDTSTGQLDTWEWSIERGAETDNKMGKFYTRGPHRVRWAARGTKTVKLRVYGSGAGAHTRTMNIKVG